MATTFDNCLKRGFSTIYALTVEGIPFVFVEESNKTTTTNAVPTTPTGYTAAVDALIVDRAGTISIELDRETGVGRGGSVQFVLSHEALNRAGYLDDLFGRPTQKIALASTVDQSATTINANGAGAWTGSHAYLNKEFFTFTGSTTNSFTGCVRGAVGEKYIHKAESFSSYRFIHDRPQSWRGRLVTLSEHLVDPTGRIIENNWLSGTYQREVWVGFIDIQPRPGRHGMVFDCLPLERRLTQKIGFSQVWNEVQPMTLVDGHTIDVHVTDGTDTKFDQYIHNESKSWGGDTAGEEFVGASNEGANWWLAYYFAGWLREGDSTLDDSNGGPWNLLPGSPFNQFGADGSRVVSMTPGGLTWDVWAAPGVGPAWFDDMGSIGSEYKSSIYFAYKSESTLSSPLHWLVLKAVEAGTFQDYDLPTTGLALLEGGESPELVQYDSGGNIDWGIAGEHKKLRITHRELIQTPPAELWTHGPHKEAVVKDLKFAIVTGTFGKLPKAALELITSSGGAGVFSSTYDVLALGHGHAIPEERVNLESFTKQGNLIDAVAVCAESGPASFAELCGGWFVLSGGCVVQKRQDDGTIKLEFVKHHVGLWTVGPGTTSITSDDILLSGVSDLSVVEAPNAVSIKSDTIGFTNSIPEITIRDIPKIQQEGTHKVDINAGGMTTQDALTAAQKLIAYGDGQFSLKLPLAPWVAIKPGDRVAIDMTADGVGHPITFDYENGTHPMAEKMAARCMGVSRNLITGTQNATFLLYSSTLPALLLAPTSTVINVSGSDVTITATDADWFSAGDLVELYNPGNEELGTPQIATATISSKAANVLTLDAVPAWIANNTTRVTFPPYDNATADQKNFAYVKDDNFYRWY